MMVKICGITRREDADVAVEAGASAIGFVFYPRSPRFVTAQQAAEIGRGLDVWKVGVFVDESAKAIEEAMRVAQLDVAQIYGGEAPAGARVWKAFRMNGAYQTSSLPAVGPAFQAAAGLRPGGDADWKVGGRLKARPHFASLECEAVLFDGAGNGLSFDWRQAKDFAAKVIIAGGLDASNVAEAIHVAQPWGVDACSRLESSPGVKDHEKMKRFIHTALQA
jgi:phosphoribosylanthranilate isomerase